MKKVLSIIMAILMVLSVASVSVLAASKSSSSSKKSSTKTSSSAKKKTAKKLGDGVYEVPFSMWHAKEDRASMGNFSVEQTSKVTIKNGKITAVIYCKNLAEEFKDMDLSAMLHSNGKKAWMKVEDGKGGWNDVKVIATWPDGSQKEIEVPLPSQKTYYKTKSESGTKEMGEVEARLKFDWANAKKVS